MCESASGLLLFHERRLLCTVSSLASASSSAKPSSSTTAWNADVRVFDRNSGARWIKPASSDELPTTKLRSGCRFVKHLLRCRWELHVLQPSTAAADMEQALGVCGLHSFLFDRRLLNPSRKLRDGVAREHSRSFIEHSERECCCARIVCHCDECGVGQHGWVDRLCVGYLRLAAAHAPTTPSSAAAAAGTSCTATTAQSSTEPQPSS